MENKKCVVIGVCGGIAAYKVCTLVSHLTQKGVEVHVLMSKAAQEFVTPLTFQTLSHQRVITDMFSVNYEPDVHHISLAEKADVFVLAPATADVLAKAAHGIADDMVTTTFLASRAKKIVFPAMNSGMLENPITQKNLSTLQEAGVLVADSGSGYLACGAIGSGRLPEPEEMEKIVLSSLYEDRYLEGKKVLITAGPTQEALDPVRYLTNHSTGKMGYALAEAARNAGATVTLVAGKTSLKDVQGVEMVHVLSAQDMAEAVFARSDEQDILVLAAAVADYRPVEVSAEKMHKKDGELTLQLERTTDILATLGQQRKEGQILCGFAMETEDLLARAKEKLMRKNCDYIVANSLREKGAGFGTDTNHVTIIGKEEMLDLGLISKSLTAEKILRAITRGK